MALNGTISLAAVGVGAEINTAAKQASSSGNKNPCCWFELNVSIFHNIISFSCFGFVAVVPGNPKTQTVSYSFPKLCAALRRKFGTEAACGADGRYVFGSVSRDESHYQWRCLGFCSGDATPVWRIGMRQVSSAILAHRNQTNVSCDAQISRTMSSAASTSRHLRSPLAMGEQRKAGSW